MAEWACPHEELASAYVLGTLHGAELAHYDSHLNECPACHLAVQELAGVAELLLYASQPVAPPPELKGRIMSRLPAVLQEQAPRHVFKRPITTLRRPVWAIAAMVVMALGLGGLGWQIARLSAELTDLQLQYRLLANGSEVAVRRISLDGTEAAPKAQGMLLFVPAREGVQVVLRATGLQELAGQQVYHLWMLKDGQRVSGGTFVADSRGWAVHTHWFPEADAWDAVGVTLEPNSEPVPRGQKVLGGSL